MGNLLSTGATKRKYQHEQDDDCCSYHATTSTGPSCRKKRKLCCACECANSTKDDNNTQEEGMKKKSSLNNVEDSSCRNNNTASNNQIGDASIPEATIKPPSTENAANKITTEGEALSRTATTNTIEPKPISVTETKIDKTPTSPKATAEQIRPLSSTEANTKIDKASTASNATSNQLKPSSITETKVDKTPTAPNATINQLKPSNSTETKVDKLPTAPNATTDKSKPLSSIETPTPPKATVDNSKPLSSTEAKDKKPEADGILDTEVSFDRRIQLNELEDTYVNFLREEFIFPNVNREAFLTAGLTIERGLMIHSGSHIMVDLVNAFANELSRMYGKQTRMFTRTPQDVIHSCSEAERFMRRITNSVEKCAKDIPIIIWVQDLRSFLQFCNVSKKADSSAVGTLSTLFKTYLGNSSKYTRLFVIGTVDDFGIIPTTLIGAGMFAKSLALSQHSNHATRMIHLKDAVIKWSVQPNDKLLEEMADKTDGFTPSQLHELAQSVYKSVLASTIKELLKKCCSKCVGDPQSLKTSEGVFTSINPSLEDWNTILKPKLKKVDDTPTVGTNITFSSVGGLDEQIKYLRENIISPLKQKDVLKEWGVEPVRGIIFYGPPGTGKTLLARAMANELNKVLEEQITETTSKGIASTSSLSQPTSKKKYSFFYRKATDCFNKYVGESERILRDLFTQAQKEAPSLIFFDEFDGLCPTRTSSTFQFYTNIVTTLLGLMDSVKRGDILVIAATNRLDSLDPAVRRAGRFDKSVGFPMPGKEGRENILRIHTKSWRNGNNTEILEQMAEKTVGYNGADLEHLARETLLLAMQRLLEAKTPEMKVTPEDWHTALSSFKPSNNSGKIEFGSGTTFLERVPAGVKLLLQSNVAKIEEKLQTIFTDIKENKSGNCSGGLNSFLISSRSENDDAVNRYLVPLLLTDSKLSKDVASYTLDLSDVQRLTKDSVRTTISQLRSPPDGKIALLLVPQIEMFIKMKNSSANDGGIVDYVLTELQTLRGKNIILLATSKLPLNKVHEMEEILSLFKDVGGSKFHEFIPPSHPELESFFKTISPLEKEFSKQLQYVVKFGEGKDVATLLDLHAELQRMLQEKKGEENKTDEIILHQLKTLFKAFDNHKTMGRNHLQLYI